MAAYFGDGDAAIRELSAALHLMPFEPLRHLSFIGMGVRSLCRGPIRSGEFMGTKRSKGFPGLLLGAKNRDGRSGAAGERGEARRMGRQLMRQDPDLTIAEARQAWPFTPAFMFRLGDGLEIAGLPRA
jgi:hypothetical protein